MVFKEQEQNKEHNTIRIDLRLLGEDFQLYQYQPQNFLLQKIKNTNLWSHTHQSQIIDFLKNISNLYKPIPYHNLTHAFDVMTNLDSYLVAYGWQQKLKISAQKRIFMLIAAYAHDGGHQGLTNSFYKNSNNILSTYSQSPLQYMHGSNLRRLFKQHHLQVSIQILQDLTEMILRTDNYYHDWLLMKGVKLKGESQDALREQRNSQIMCCLLMHAADLNNTCKQVEINIQWTNLLYEEFQFQKRLQIELGLKPTVSGYMSRREIANSNVFFLGQMVLPLYKLISDFTPKFEDLVIRVESNKNYWASIV